MTMTNACELDERKMFDQRFSYYLTRVRKAETILRELEQFAGAQRDMPLKVLSVGCEFGFIEYCLAQWTQWDIIASDLDASLINSYPQFSKHIKLQVLDATSLPFGDEEFDLVIFNHVIEHIPSYANATKELHRVLKKNGILYLATPNLHRKMVSWRVSFAKKKNLRLDKRMKYHMGFSANELDVLLEDFSLTQMINRAHMQSTLRGFSALAHILPDSLCRRYAQTNVYICRK